MRLLAAALVLLLLIVDGCGFLIFCSAKPISPQDLSRPLRKILFASCNDQDDSSPWHHLTQFQPDLFLWLGDAIYADNWSEDRHESVDVMQRKWNQAKHAPEYQDLRDNTLITGIWDDHDYGSNNGGAEYADRDATQKMFLDFLDEPSDSERWTRPGVYTSLRWGPAGKRVMLVMLDVRYFKGIAPEGDILGDVQWKWLEEELYKYASETDLLLIASGIQIIPVKPRHEKWADYPKSRERLLTLLLRSSARNIILLSGDIHYAEISEIRCGQRQIVEATSSGLTHSVGTKFEVTPDLHHQVGPLYLHRNFGTLEIDWEAQTVHVSARSVATGDVALRIKVPLHSELEPACTGDELRNSLSYEPLPVKLHHGGCSADPNGTCIRRRRETNKELTTHE